MQEGLLAYKADFERVFAVDDPNAPVDFRPREAEILAFLNTHQYIMGVGVRTEGKPAESKDNLFLLQLYALAYEPYLRVCATLRQNPQ